ncbi:MAG: cytochrome P450, partial [Verrucomicrobia bacterium]|nr:cytochrome P450 [Verrucomicrobiota bacterium]
ARYQGRPLTREEMMGFANLTFAGGRDTVIHSLTSILAYFGENPTALSYLREDPRRIVLASEEFFRVFMPLTHIGRTCPVATQVQGAEVPAGQRISLGWASANFDEKAFAAPHEIRLDRKPNPHVSFGVGTHLCLGAPHARLLVRTLLQQLVAKIGRIDILSSVNRLEKEPDFERKVGYESLTLRFTAS